MWLKSFKHLPWINALTTCCDKFILFPNQKFQKYPRTSSNSPDVRQYSSNICGFFIDISSKETFHFIVCVIKWYQHVSEGVPKFAEWGKPCSNDFLCWIWNNNDIAWIFLSLNLLIYSIFSTKTFIFTQPPNNKKLINVTLFYKYTFLYIKSSGAQWEKSLIYILYKIYCSLYMRLLPFLNWFTQSCSVIVSASSRVICFPYFVIRILSIWRMFGICLKWRRWHSCKTIMNVINIIC